MESNDPNRLSEKVKQERQLPRFLANCVCFTFVGIFLTWNIGRIDIPFALVSGISVSIVSWLLVPSFVKLQDGLSKRGKRNF